jgi:hypothetical protein
MVKRITRRSLERFIKNDLPKKLQEDLLDLRIIREADIACCVYFHLRRFIGTDRTLKVFAERPSQKTKHIVDMVIFKDIPNKPPKPRIAFELKWNRKRISKKDRDSLDQCIRKLNLAKVYFISVCKKDGVNKVIKSDLEKFRLFEIYIYPNLPPSKYKEWNARRAKVKDMF